MALTNDFKVKNGLTVIDSISAGGNLSASEGFFDSDVGIGTNNPSAKLHVDDNASTGTGLLVTGGGSGGPIATFRRDVGNTGSEIYINAGGSDPQIVFKRNTDYYSIGADASENKFKISDNSALGTNDRFTIDGSGNVGIGITDPDQALEIGAGGKLKLSRADNARSLLLYTDNNFATVESDTDPFLLKSADRIQFEANGAERMRIDSSGNVGIGTTSPAQKLHIQDTNGANIVLNSNTGGENSGIFMTEAAAASPYTNGAYVHYDGSNNAFKINTGTSSLATRFTILRDNGNVGIGTTAPDNKLTVSGAISATGNISTTGNILSAGVNIDQLFGTSGGGGDITAVTTGPYLTGGGASGSVEVGIDSACAAAWDAAVAGDISAVVAGTGLTGGGTSGSVTLNLSAGDGVQATANCVSADSTVVRTSGDQTIAGVKTFSDDTLCVAGKIVHNGDGDTYLQFNTNSMCLYTAGEAMLKVDSNKVTVNYAEGSNDFQVNTNGSTQTFFVDGSTDRVGIGTSTPTAKLTLSGSGDSIPMLEISNATNGGGAAIHFSDNAAGGMAGQTGGLVYCHQDSKSQGGAASFTLSSSESDLAIIAGTASKTARHVVKSANSVGEVDYGFYDDINTGLYQPSNNAAGLVSNGTEKLRVNSNGVQLCDELFVPTNIVHTGDTNTCIGFADDNINLIAGGENGITVNTSGVVVNNDGNANDFRVEGDTDTHALFVDGSADNVGIGTTSPVGKLTVSEAGGTGLEITPVDADAKVSLTSYDRADSAYRELNFDGYNYNFRTSGSTPRVSIINNGNVGIGCTTPTQKLAVAGDGLFTSDLTVQGDLTVTGDFTCLDTTISVTSALSVQNAGTGPALIVNQTGSNDIVDFRDDGTSVFYIEDGGFVGLGTTNPSSLLHLESASSPSLQIKDTTQSTTLKAFSQDSNAHLGTFSNHPLIFDTNSTQRMCILASGNVTLACDLTVSGGDITLGGTGRIQGIDTVSSGTDAANKTYADTKLACAGGTMTGNVILNDNVELRLGTSSDFKAFHNGTDTCLKNYTGDFRIVNDATDGDIEFCSDDGSGGITEYLRLDGGDTNIVISKNTKLTDNVQLHLGNGSDLRLFHNSTHSYIHNDTGDLNIENDATDGDIIFRSDNGSGGLADYITIDGGSVLTRFKKNTVHEDNISARFGNSSDLQIYHDGSHSYIKDAGTGDLKISSNTVRIESDGAENMIIASANGAVNLYYNNVDKLQTTASGINVCGDALISGNVCATTKSFVIDNPTTDGKLRYSVVEGNEHGVTVRGSTCSGTIELPDEWDWLVDEDSVTAQLTPVGGPHQPYVVSQDNNQVVVCSNGCYNYNIYGTRKDVEPLEVDIL